MSVLQLTLLLIALVLLGAAVLRLLWAPRKPEARVEVAAGTNVAQPAAAADEPAIELPDPAPTLQLLYSLAFSGGPGVQALSPVTADTAAQQADKNELLNAAAQLLTRIETRPEYAPRRPQLLPQLLTTLNRDETSLRQLAQLVGQDPTLAGNVLRLVNSPLYRTRPEAVESLERAVTLLGTTGLRSIVAAALLQPELTGGIGPLSRLPTLVWDLSLHCALAAASYAILIEDCDPFAAELLGMLQGMGTIIVVRVCRDQYDLRPQLPADFATVHALLEAWSLPTARRIGETWELSDRISTALHDQLMQTGPELFSPLGRALRFGLLAGAAAVLVRNGQVDLQQGRELLGNLQDSRLDTLWERLTRNRRRVG